MPSWKTQKEGDSSDFGEIAPTTRHYPALQIKAKLVLRYRQAASVSFHGVVALG
jgi:hypothetical protein